MTVEERIKTYAKEIGVDLIGITTAEPFEEAYRRLIKLERKGYLSPWAEKNLQKRCQPQMLMEDAQSLIAVGISYLQAEAHIDGKFRGKLARFAQLKDYHLVLKEKMKKLVIFIRKEYPEAKAEIFVDTGPLIDREIAHRAGLGFFGKNSALINPEYGSFISLGEILLNIYLKPDSPLKIGCGECDLCLQACPQQAIKSPGEILSTECLAHYTQEKGLLSDSVSKSLGTRLWGCDTCQDICPYNRQAITGSGLFEPHSLGFMPDLEQIVNLSNSQFRDLVEDTVMGWRGKTTLQRNALIILGNLKDSDSLPILKTALQDQRPVIRGTAAWALGQIAGPETINILQEVKNFEKDPGVLQVIRTVLTKKSN